MRGPRARFAVAQGLLARPRLAQRVLGGQLLPERVLEGRLVAVLSLAVVGAVAGCGSQTPGIATNPPLGTSGGPVSTTATTAGETAQGGVRTVLAPLGLNLRAAPSRDAQVLGSLARGTVVSVLGHTSENGGWYHVRGETQTGWISDDPTYSSPRRFSLYASEAQQFSVLYPDTWTFAETGNEVVFRSQSGPDSIVVTMAPSLDALGQPGRPGYSLVSTASFEVYGVTGVLRQYRRTAPGPTPAPGEPPYLDHLTEFRATVDPRHAIRIAFDDATGADQQIFLDFAHSMVLVPLTTTSATTTSSGASTSPTP